MTHTPLISVILPVYNEERFIGMAIDSILNQTFSDFELIIVNDCSNDNTQNILKQKQECDSRIIIHTLNENSGIVTALNTGLKIARGKYIARMDSDDISLPDRFMTQVKHLESHENIGVLGSNIHVVNSSGKVISNFINNPKLPQTSGEIRWALLFSNSLMHPVVMFRREVVIGVGGYFKNIVHAEDYDLWVRLADKTKFVNLRQVHLLLRKHDKNITVVHFDKSVQTGCEVSKRYINSVIQNNISQPVINALWEIDNYDTKNIEQAAELIVTLFKTITAKWDLSRHERSMISMDVARRLTLLAIITYPLSQKWKILRKALSYNPPTVIKQLVISGIRRAWAMIKKLM